MVRGIRDPISEGVIGRIGTGKGKAQVLSISDLAKQLALRINGGGSGGGSGNVVGPASAVDLDFVQFDGTSGTLIKDGGLSRDTDGTLAANSDLHIPSQKAVKTYVDAASATIPTAANPTATASDTAVNGTSAHFMRADAAPAVQKVSASVFGVVKADGTTITAAGGVLSAAGAAPGFGVGFSNVAPQSTAYFTCPFGPAGSNIIPGPNTLFATPFYVATSTTFTKMGVHVITGAAGKNAELGIYNNNGGLPGTLLHDAGSVAVATSSADAEITGLSWTLSPGWYWLTVAFDGSPTVSGSTTDIGGWIGRDHGTGIAAVVAGVSATWSFSSGNLPTPFPTISYKITSITYPYLRL